MSANHDVALKNVAAFVHLAELGCDGQCSQSAVAVGREADKGRTSAKPAETADDAEGRSIASGSLAVSAGNEYAHKIRGLAGRADGFRAGVLDAPGLQTVDNGFAGHMRVIEQILQIQENFHFGHLVNVLYRPLCSLEAWRSSRMKDSIGNYS